jgi:hypothetical protein
MSSDEFENVVRKEDRVLLGFVLILVLATVLKPWLLVWDLGMPLTVMAGLGTMRVVGWLRSFNLTPSESAD